MVDRPRWPANSVDEETKGEPVVLGSLYINNSVEGVKEC